MLNESAPEERIFFEGHPAVVGSISRVLIALLTLGVGALYFWARSRTVRYLISSQRILIEEGLFSQRVHSIELYHIDDIEIEKPFGQRLLGTGNILFYTKDVSTPKVWLKRLPINVRELYEQIRPAIQEAKHRQFLYREQDTGH